MNLLCSRLFMHEFPKEGAIRQHWQQYISEERSSVASALEVLEKMAALPKIRT